MLEVKNLRKEYRNKKGVVTKALDDVSLNFPETGMVFILGKSGSGKSTLLNVCGGLDKADSGEIIIKGKSSKEFTGPDFDSYRNTYVGFVFQDYNILDEFTVEQNIALALELQNKKPDKAVIDKLLEDVDLTDFATRKPNTLSGGQKQRVAIARALVKEPEIIMADEPTGALDSKTGQQVFDTLKKLSQSKLVLVISHDRDFAEQYGDRIIELKDGKILSDQTRSEEDGGAKNVRFFGTDTVCVANGSEVTDEDLQNIKKFLKKAGGSAVISTSREHIANIKESRPEINVGSFENIKEQPVSKTYEKQSLIRSHLPARHAIKMGANSLKSKPVRLVFTIFLSIVAFILFGLASTLMLFDGKQVTVNTFVDSDDQYLILSKGYYGKYTSYENGEIQYQDKDRKQETLYTVDEYKKFAEKYNGAIAVANFNGRMDNIRLGQYGNQYYSEYIANAILDNDSVEILNGRRPSAVDEIAVSDYVYNAIALPKTKFTDSKGKEKTISNPEDLLYSETNNVTLKISDKEFKVVGIFRLETPSSEFDELKNAAKEDKLFAGSESVADKWEQYLETSLLSSIMVTEDLIKQFSSSNNQNLWAYQYFNYTQGELRIWYPTENNWSGYVSYIGKYSDEHPFPLFDLYDFSGNKVTSLSGNSIALSISYLGSLYSEAYNNYINELGNSSEEQDIIDAEIQAARLEYEMEHLLVDKYFNQYSFDNDVQNWHYQLEYERGQAQINGEEFDEQAYRLEYPEPQNTDRNEYGRFIYYSGDSEYYAAYDAYMDSVRETAGTLKAYKTLIYQARKAAREKFIAQNPEPVHPGDDASRDELNDYNNEYSQWSSDLWNAQYEAEKAVNPLYKLNYLSSLNLSRQEILDLFEEAGELIPNYQVNIGIKNAYNEFETVTVAGMFFDNINDGCAYLSDTLYAKYYVSENSNSYRSEYVTKYVAPEDAYISSIYIPYAHDSASVQELVDLTYARADDDSTVIIKNSQMQQLDMFIEMADTLGTAFFISGIVLALFAFLLMFNFISASIGAKRKEIGILRAIGARTRDVYKIFMSESMIIALICFIVSTIGTLGLCVLLNNILTAETIIVISIFSFGPLSVLCILGIALLTAVISTVIPVAMYSRKPPIESIRTL